MSDEIVFNAISFLINPSFECVKDPKDNHQPRFCAGYELFFEHADGKLKNIAARWKQQQNDHQERTQTRGIYNAFDDLVKNQK